ncbi:MAG: DsbC family protein, partial [Pseudomonadales bacterium]|nr:DsbC family protein [Pseudomonadales bacterium]
MKSLVVSRVRGKDMRLLLSVLLGLLILSPQLQAQILKAEQKQAPALRDIIEQRLQMANPMIIVDAVSPSDIDGLYEVTANNGQIFLTTVDGKYLIDGKVLRVEAGKFVDVMDEKQKPVRAALLAQVPLENFIRFPPEGEVKGVLNVFTDVDCGYCQKLHSEMPELNALGIEVRYLAFPRAGLGSASYQKIASAWCADDKQ